MANYNIPLEQCRKGGLASGAALRRKAIEEYNENPRHCLHCGILLEVGERQASARKRHKFCSQKCTAKFRWAKWREETGNPEPRKWGAWTTTSPFKLKKQVRRAQINQHARTVYFCRFPTETACCELCGENRLLPDVAHVRAVHTFSGDASLIEINTLSNLIGLCKICHALFDSFKISKDVITKKVENRSPRPDFRKKT